MIPSKTVAEIQEAARIEDVVGEFVNLRKRGVNLIGLCPFHNERTPSFNVSPTRNIFKCFGCGKGGTPASFLMEHENMSYPDALRWIAKRYNIEIQEVEYSPEQRQEQQLADSIYIVNEFAADFYQKQLFETDEGRSIALAYFQKRGLTEETIRKFGLGYALNQRDALVQSARANAHDLTMLREAGLCSEDKSRDFFRDRVMFTIHGMSGKAAAFAGRTMSTEAKVPKYVNSPETKVYVKNKILYGAFQAKNAIRKKDRCILVEGYMDVISLHQAGIENALASSGTALTEGQVALIHRQTENLTLFFDADSAGFNAAVKGFGMALRAGMNVQIVQLPQGEDPDSFAMANGGPAVTEYMEKNAKDIVLFLTEKKLAATAGDPIKKAGLLREIAEIIALSSDALKRSVYIRECAELLAVDQEAMTAEINRIVQTDLRKWREKQEKDAREFPEETGGLASDPEMPQQVDGQQPQRPQTKIETQKQAFVGSDAAQELDLLRILVHFGTEILDKEENITVAEHLLADLEEALETFENQLMARIVRESIQEVVAGRIPHQDFFIHHPDSEIADFCLNLLVAPFEMSPNWEERHNFPLQNQPMPHLNFTKDMEQSIARFKLHKIQNMCTFNQGRIRTAGESGDSEGVERYIRLQMKLYESRDKLAKVLGTIIFR